MNSAFTYTNVHNVVPFMSNHRRYNIHNGAGKTWTHSPDHIFVNRIDMQVEVTPVPIEDLANLPTGETSATIRQRVIAARAIQTERFKEDKGIYCNAQMSGKMLMKYAKLEDDASNYLSVAMKHLDLSARAYDRILKVSRTIADLARSELVKEEHIAEAVGYRNLDRSTWGE